MKTVTCLMLAGAAVAMAGCSTLPGSSLGATFSAERYLNADHGGPGFTGALAKEYTELGRRSAFTDERWHNSTAYIAKAQLAESGTAPAPWTPEELGVNGENTTLYQNVVATIAANRDERPEACARAQAMWDQYIEMVRAGAGACIPVEEARALLDEALAACSPGVAQSGGFVIYFGFDRADLTAQAAETIDGIVAAAQEMGATALSVVGHTDTVGSLEYNQGLSERRARTVGNALVARGIPADALTLAGRSFLEPARVTGPNVNEPLNRRVEVSLSK